MSRFLILLALVLALGPLAAAQSDPSQFSYNLANLHTYLLSPTGTNWQSGQSYARSLGGYLASINDGLEQEFINSRYSTVAAGFWIGLSDAAVEGVYEWDSGEPLTFTNWCPGEPNNFGGDEDFVHAVYTPGNFCWNDTTSPYTGPTSAPTLALVELAFGDRINFDYNLPGSCNVLPSPFGAPGNPDGISWNGAGTLNKALIARTVYAGMPVVSLEYLLVQANGPVSVPLGGPFFPRPAPQIANEVRIPIPAGTKGVSYAWEFLCAELFNNSFNDGMSIAVVDLQGNLIFELDYADTSWVQENIPASTLCSGTSTLVRPVGSPGVQTRAHVLPPLPTPAFLSIVCWNGGDNNASSAVAVDAIQFWGTGAFKLNLSAPFGPGSLRLQNTGGVPGSSYVTAVTLTPGAFPHGWLFGLDITPNELLTQIASGPPFSGVLSQNGSSTFQIPTGVPFGIPIHAVSLQFQGGAGFGTFLGASAPELFITQ